MAEIKWIKLFTNVFDNRKIKMIQSLPDGDSIVVIWFQLLCLAGNINDDGNIYFTEEVPYTEQMLATQFNKPLALIQFAIKTFLQFNMMDVVDDIYHISNWQKYQNIDGMEKVREQNRIRKQNQRERQYLLSQGESRDGHVTVTQCHATERREKKEESRK